ncbi:hypothetical protein FB451DRAFT_1188403 [Mycena latifolia]|nr:hypothetical protein FB451DRAFT_1188403 [Mycena latifolia]
MAGTSRAATGDPSLQRGQACAYCRRRKMASPIPSDATDGARCVVHANADPGSMTVNIRIIAAVPRPKYWKKIFVELKAASTSWNTQPRPLDLQYFFITHTSNRRPPPSQMPNIVQVPHSREPVSPQPPAADAWWDSPEPPFHMVKTLLDAFLPYATDWGFFLDPARFRHDALLPFPIGHHSRPSPALLTAVYLTSIALSGSTTLKAHEPEFLSRALSALPVSLAGLHPQKAIHALQTEILLSTYFYASGRFLEGRYHTTAAVSLAVSARLKNRASPPALWPDADTTENLDASWATIILDKSWAVALAMRPNLNLEECSGMVELPVARRRAMSTKTLLAKATILWEEANSLVVRWRPDMSSEELNQFYTAFNTLDARILDFHSTLAHTPAPTSRALLVGHSTAHAAVIQLHSIFAQNNLTSKQKCLAAAQSILALIADADLRDAAFINPVISIIWLAACEVASR